MEDLKDLLSLQIPYSDAWQACTVRSNINSSMLFDFLIRTLIRKTEIEMQKYYVDQHQKVSLSLCVAT